MKKKVLAALVMSVAFLTACGKTEAEDAMGYVPETVEAIPISTPTPEATPAAEPTEEPVQEVIPENCYRSELTNEWIDVSLQNQRPVAIMVDNEKTALPHFGLTEADVVYEMMNSTANNRVTRLMAIVKDWGSITQFGSIRSTRPTNVLLAAEWNAVLIHDGGPFYINDYIAKPYSSNFSGGFARFSNGKATEFTEYVTYDTYRNTSKNKTYDGLKQRFENSKYSTTYNDYYQGPHFQFAEGGAKLAERSDAIDCTDIELPFPHNDSRLKYNAATNTYDYYEYGSAHQDPLHDNAPLTFTNVILQDTTFNQLDQNGYLIYNVFDVSHRAGWYISEGKAIAITWERYPDDKTPQITRYFDKATGQEIQINTGKTYIGLVPSDTWNEVVLK